MSQQLCLITSPAQQASAASLSSSGEELRAPDPAAVPPEWETAQQLQRDGTTYRTVIRSVNRVRSLARLQRRLPAVGRACCSSRAARVGCMGVCSEHQGQQTIRDSMKQACGDVGKAWSSVFMLPHGCTATAERWSPWCRVACRCVRDAKQILGLSAAPLATMTAVAGAGRRPGGRRPAAWLQVQCQDWPRVPLAGPDSPRECRQAHGVHVGRCAAAGVSVRICPLRHWVAVTARAGAGRRMGWHAGRCAAAGVGVRICPSRHWVALTALAGAGRRMGCMCAAAQRPVSVSGFAARAPGWP